MPQQNNDETLRYEGELYGRMWSAVAWSEDEKMYQELSNLLFMAAKADIIEEKKANNGKYTKKKILDWQNDVNFRFSAVYQGPEPEKTYTKNLDKALEAIFPKSEKAKLNQNLADLHRERLKKNILNKYNKLKNDLDDVRVLGVGNSNLQKAAKACKIAVKTFIVFACIPAIAALDAAAAFLAPPVAILIGTVGGAAIGEITTNIAMNKSFSLANTRIDLKRDLKEYDEYTNNFYKDKRSKKTR